MAIAGFAGCVALVMLVARAAAHGRRSSAATSTTSAAGSCSSRSAWASTCRRRRSTRRCSRTRARRQSAACWVGLRGRVRAVPAARRLRRPRAPGGGRVRGRGGAPVRAALRAVPAAPDILSAWPSIRRSATRARTSSSRAPTAASGSRTTAASGSCCSSIPGDNTAVCTRQFCSYRDNAEAFDALDATVVGISSQSVDSHESFTAEHGLNVPLLADEDGEVAKAYGAHAPVVGTKRAVIIVDEEGVVALPPRPPARARLPDRRRPPRGARVECPPVRDLTALTIPACFNGPPDLGERRLHLRAGGAARRAPRWSRCRCARRRRSTRRSRSCATASAWSCATATRSSPRASRRELLLDVPDAVPADEVAAAQEAGRERWSAGHPFPTCVVCGPGARGTGCGIFPGGAAGPRRAVRRRLDARRVARRRRRARAAGAASGRRSTAPPARRSPTSATGRPMVLASLTARLGCPVRVGEPHTILSWPLGDGRAQALGRRRAVRLGRRAPVRLARALDRAATGVASARMATHYRTCPFCEATCGLEIETEGREVVSVRGDARGRLQPRLHLPEGVRAQAAPRGPGPADHAAGAPRRRARRGDLGRGVRGDRPAARADPRRARPQRGRRLPRQPERPQPVGAHATGRRWLRALGTQNIYTASTVDQMPKQVSAGLMFGDDAVGPGARRRPHRPPADPRRQPARVERQPADRARHARAAARASASAAARSSWSTRAARAPPRRPTSTTSSGRAPTRCCSRRWRARSSRRASSTPGALAEHLNGLDEVARARARLHARARWRPRAASRPSEIRRMARELAAAERAAVYGRIGTCTQEFGTLASWLVDVLNVLTGNLDREGGAMFPLRGGRASGTRPGAGGSGKGVRFGRWQSRVRGLPEAFGELPVSASPRRSTRPARARSARCHGRRQPGRLDAEQRPARARARGARLHGRVDIYVNETTRHADVILPAPGAAREVALRPRALPAGRAQRRELLAAGVRARGPGRVGGLPAPRRDRRRARARTPTSTRSTTSSSRR